MMRRATVTAGVLAAVLTATFCAQADLPNTVDPARLAEVLDKARNAMEAVQTETGGTLTSRFGSGTRTQKVQRAIYEASQHWRVANDMYRDAVPADPQWATDFDTVTNALAQAEQAMAPGPAAGEAAINAVNTHIGNALTALDSARGRNGVPDIKGALKSLTKSLTEVNTKVKSMQASGADQASIEDLQKSVKQATQSWQSVTKAVIDVNALGLDHGQLQRLQQVADVQNRHIEFMNNPAIAQSVALMATEAAEAKTQAEEFQKRLGEALEELGQQDISTDTGDPKEELNTDTKSSSQKRRVRLPIIELIRHMKQK